MAISGCSLSPPRTRCTCRFHHAVRARKRLTRRCVTSHSTGHQSRWHRTTLTDLCLCGSRDYAQEELVAEMSAAYLCGVCGIANVTIDNSAAYLQSWMAVLRHDATLLVQAAAQAQRAADSIQNVQPEVGA